MKKYLTSSITIVFYIMIFVATTQTSVLAVPFMDGYSADPETEYVINLKQIGTTGITLQVANSKMMVQTKHSGIGKVTRITFTYIW